MEITTTMGKRGFLSESGAVRTLVRAARADMATGWRAGAFA